MIARAQTQEVVSELATTAYGSEATKKKRREVKDKGGGKALLVTTSTGAKV